MTRFSRFAALILLALSLSICLRAEASEPADCGCGGRAGDELTSPTVQPVEDLHSFLPVFASEAAPSQLRDMDEIGPGRDASVTPDRVNALFEKIKDAYPDINFSAAWDDPTVNAFAWKQGGQRYVQIMGGMLRHRAMQIEGVAVVLAHEVGHHYGGDPKYPGSDLSCEGQADYWATKVGLREVYNGGQASDSPEYQSVVSGGIAQTYALLSGGLRYNFYSYENIARMYYERAGCTHPMPDCRKLTYEAGVAKTPKPDCASLSGAEAVSEVRFRSLADPAFNPRTTLEDVIRRRSARGVRPTSEPAVDAPAAYLPDAKGHSHGEPDGPSDDESNDESESLDEESAKNIWLPYTPPADSESDSGDDKSEEYGARSFLPTPSGRSDIELQEYKEILREAAASAEDAAGADDKEFAQIMSARMERAIAPKLDSAERSSTGRTQGSSVEEASGLSNPRFLRNFRRLVNAATEPNSGIFPAIGSPAARQVGPGVQEVSASKFADCVAVGTRRGGRNEFCCTGVLVGANTVVTAGHCWGCSGGGNPTAVVFVGNQITGQGRVYRGTATRHPNYNPQTLANDIAVIVLEEDVQGVVPRPIADANALGGAYFVRAVGFGYNDFAATTGFGTKRMVDVPIASRTCSGANDATRYGCHRDNELVAGYLGLGADSCNGDSGGPCYLLNDGDDAREDDSWLVIGITSRSTAKGTRPCGDGGNYVRLDKYLSFVSSVPNAKLAHARQSGDGLLASERP